jgi:ATP-dependent Clp protease, protease subunit
MNLLSPNLLQLYLNNRGRGAGARILPAARKGSKEATVYIYDAIVPDDVSAEWWGGISAQRLVPEIRALEADRIHLRFNSPGGDVFAARAIEAALLEHPAEIISYIDGLAASAATVLALTGDTVQIGAGAFFMVHRAWSIAIGNSKEMQKTADLLEQVDGTLMNTYEQRTSRARAVISQWMDEETWFDGNAAIEAGFADSLIERAVEADEAMASARVWDLRAYQNPPKIPAPAFAPAPAPKSEAASRERERAMARVRLSMLAA